MASLSDKNDDTGPKNQDDGGGVVGKSKKKKNKEAAALLRKQLMMGASVPATKTPSSASASSLSLPPPPPQKPMSEAPVKESKDATSGAQRSPKYGDASNRSPSRDRQPPPQSSSSSSIAPVDALEHSGRIHGPARSGGEGRSVLVYSRDSSSRRGKRSGNSLKDTIREERHGRMRTDMMGGGGMSAQEIFARHGKKLGGGIAMKPIQFQKGQGIKSSGREDDYVDDYEFGKFQDDEDGSSSKRQRRGHDPEAEERKRQRQEESRAQSLHAKQSAVQDRCWWWMESRGSFQKHRLLSLGDHVSLVLVPPHMAVTKDHCILCPIAFAPSFLACEDEVWNEVRHFRSALSQMFAAEGKRIICSETVLTSRGFFQARMDVLPVPKHVEQDAPLYFQSAMMEQAEEWGTHSRKLIKTATMGKDLNLDLRRVIPRNASFPYCHVEWTDGGFVQIIENESFSPDFALDTVVAMLGDDGDDDPMRLRRKRRGDNADQNWEQERKAVLDFVSRWKTHDWTFQLDGGGDGQSTGDAQQEETSKPSSSPSLPWRDSRDR